MDNIVEILLKIYEPISPKHFDKNEWWIISLFFFIGFIVFYLHKKSRLVTTSELLLIFFLNIYLASLGDYILAMDPVDLYDTVDLNSGELFDIPLHMIIYPGTIYIALHFYLLIRPKKSYYIVFWALLLTFLDWISTHFFHLYTYKGWNLRYSFLVYLVIMTVNLLLLTRVRKSFSKFR
ncbi:MULTISPECIES: hypothetical protein [unclassified Bacillus (in: firmicutes)]|uniref:hypothetical protein n=1 Tax=unclassified Bacillus (in: firmicutes) TaxID=185979 RepID=UPI0008F12383|nr:MULTISPECIES: hypothetical protein [unclassified Bacillus (in: firmicutes)]SFB19568.1 hypothetical protein SAMN02799634_1089 [Bacillus sp. UNCCL13]SFQ90693.1 hypothetical protein SAMN04488577_3825 [Bacillus sp. cl95]